MRCLRCARETTDGASFCPDCLAKMEQHPVKPGTPVILPAAPKAAPKENTVRRRKPEEEIRSLRKYIRHLWIVLLCCLLIIGGLCTYIFFHWNDTSKGPIGQNYSTTESTAPLPGSVAG